MALTASGDKSGALVRDGVCSALQGQGLTPTETLEERIDLIFTAGRQAGRQTARLGAGCGNARDVSRHTVKSHTCIWWN